MADNTTLGATSGGDTIRDIDRAGKKTQVVVLDAGGQAGPESLVTAANPLPVAIISGGGGGVVTQPTGTNLHAVVDSSALPSGASTSALQTSGNASLTTLATNSPALGQALAAAAVPVVLTAIQLAALTPPAAITGFATSALQSSIVTAIGSPLQAAVALPAGNNTIGQVNGNGAVVENIPAVTAGAYTLGWVIGGIQTFANILPANFNGQLNSIALKFKRTVQSGSFAVAIFKSSPAGTFADAGLPAIAAADSAALVDIYYLTAPESPLGTHTFYSLNGIGKQIAGASTSLFAVVIAVTAPANPASTSDMSLDLGVGW